MAFVWLLLLGVLVGFFGAYIARARAERGSVPWRVVLVVLGVALLVLGLWFVVMVGVVGPSLRSM
jgi:hypothetical protein